MNTVPTRRQLLLGTAAASLLALAGCASPQIADYAAEKPVLDLREYFNGVVDGHGIFTEVLGSGSNRQLLAIWYAYLNGEQRWMTALGPITGNSATIGPIAWRTGASAATASRMQG